MPRGKGAVDPALTEEQALGLWNEDERRVQAQPLIGFLNDLLQEPR